MDYLKITYRNSCDIGGSVFAAPETAFKYTMFLDYDVKEGTYELIEEGRENGNKDFVPDFKKLQKKYSIGMIVSEYTYDALCHIPLHDSVYIKTKELETSRALNFAVQLNEWAKGGAAHITITFNVDYVINNFWFREDSENCKLFQTGSSNHSNSAFIFFGRALW